MRAGADVIQLDEPWSATIQGGACGIAVRAINRALQGITVPTVVHLCFGWRVWCRATTSRSVRLPRRTGRYGRGTISIRRRSQGSIDLGVLTDIAPKKIMLGVLNLDDLKIETAETVAV